MRVGDYEVRALVDGTFGLDGGAMFGIVPKPLWQRVTTADESNRIPLAARCLLVQGHDRTILVDTGLGGKFDDKRAGIFAVERPGGGLPGHLDSLGITPEDVTDVVLTHLHFDHCGGTTWRDAEGRLRLTYPGATHHVQLRQWEWARSPTDKDAGSFRDEDFAPLRNSGRLELIDGDAELFPGFALRVVDGHTTAMQMVLLEGEDATLLFAADLVPTSGHLGWPYIMAYDNRPLTTLEEKRSWLPRVATGDWILVFQHDPEIAAARIAIEDGRPMVRQRLEL